MPNVPRVPGVPALASYAISSIVLLTRDILSAVLGFSITRWGIFLNGVPVIANDNTVSFDFRQDWPMSDYPTEEGGFQNYNKVEQPAQIRIRMSRGGDDADRQAFINSIKAVAATTELFDVLTPEEVFIGYCFDHVDYHREATKGVGLLTADLWLKEVRESAAGTSFQNTQVPGAAGRQSLGVVQPQPATVLPGGDVVPTFF